MSINQLDLNDYIKGATDDTLIGNSGDSLNVNVTNPLDVTGAQLTVEIEHAKIHEGLRYSFDEIIVINSGSSHYHGFTTPNSDIYFHLDYSVSAQSDSEVRLYEGSTFTGGTTQVYYNRNRNSTNTGNLTVVHSPTVTADGTELEAHAFGDSGKIAGSTGGVRFEWMLKKNTKYLIKITSGSNGNKHDVAVNWYEGGPDL